MKIYEALEISAVKIYFLGKRFTTFSRTIKINEFFFMFASSKI